MKINGPLALCRFCGFDYVTCLVVFDRMVKLYIMPLLQTHFCTLPSPNSCTQILRYGYKPNSTKQGGQCRHPRHATACCLPDQKTCQRHQCGEAYFRQNAWWVTEGVSAEAYQGGGKSSPFAVFFHNLMAVAETAYKGSDASTTDRSQFRGRIQDGQGDWHFPARGRQSERSSYHTQRRLCHASSCRDKEWPLVGGIQ